MGANREKYQADFDLERFIDMLANLNAQAILQIKGLK